MLRFCCSSINCLLKIPHAPQIRYHAYNVDEQAATLTLCKKHGIIVQAYSALTPITTMPSALDCSSCENAEREWSRQHSDKTSPAPAAAVSL